MTSTLRRGILVGGIAIALTPAALAQAYPARPIRFVVPYAPGGGVDIITRMIAEKLQLAWGQAVIVENRAGGGGTIGTDLVAKAPANGYTLLMGYVGNFAISPWLVSKLPYDPVKDFAPVCLTTTAPSLLVTHPSLPVTTAKELVALAKSKPGALSYASSGTGTVGHLVAEMFKSVTGTDLVHVPYKGNPLAVSDLLGGHVHVMFSAPSAAMPFLQKKQLRVLAVTGNKRLPDLPDTPTFAEAGYPKVDASGWYGVMAPAGTPKEIITSLNRELVRIMAMDDIKERLAALGYAVESSTPEEFAQIIKTDLVKWREVVRVSGAKAD